jgi:hypothetical protein
MDDTVAGQSVDSWLTRAHAASKSSASAHSVSESAAAPISDRLRESWDPWEVWLRRIHQPRQRLAALQVQSPDLAP